MKKLIIIIILLLATSVNSQWNFNPTKNVWTYNPVKNQWGYNPVDSSWYPPSAYDSEAQAYFDALTTPLSNSIKTDINTFVLMLKDSLSTALLSTYFDRMWIFANETEESALQSLVNVGSTDATNVHSTAFEVDRGYTGDGADDYINTNYNPSTDKVVFAQNSASTGIYSRTDVNENTADLGQVDGGNTFAIRYGNVFYYRLNQGLDNSSIANTNSQGLFTISRTASNIITAYQNSTPLDTSTQVSSAIRNGDILLLCGSIGIELSNRQLAFCFIGKSLTATEVRKIFNCIEWYLDEIGAGVVP